MFGGVADAGGMVRSVGAFAEASLQITRSFVVAVCVVCIPYNSKKFEDIFNDYVIQDILGCLA